MKWREFIACIALVGGLTCFIMDAFAQEVLCAYEARSHGGKGEVIRGTYAEVTSASDQYIYTEVNGKNVWSPCAQAEHNCIGETSQHFNDEFDKSAYYQTRFTDLKCFSDEYCSRDMRRAMNLYQEKIYAVRFGKLKCARVR